jgi:hypothetical protein
MIDPPEVAQLRNLVIQENGIPALIDRMREVFPQLAEQITMNLHPFLVLLGLPVVPEGLGFRRMELIESPIPVEGLVHVDRLLALGYRREDVLWAWRECNGNVEAIEERLRGL